MKIVCAMLVLLSLFTSCASRPPAVTRESRDGVIHLSNGVIEATVDPAKGRIMGFAFVGDDNLLWANPDAPQDQWLRWGGDKVWLWPQSAWRERTGQDWPPPGDPPAQPHHVRATRNGLVMTSPVVSQYGVRLVRELSMAPGQPTLTIVNRAEVVDPALARDVALWTVTQVPPVDEVIATPIFHRSPAGVNSPVYPKALGDHKEKWPSPQPSLNYPGDVVFTRPTAASAKVGLDADKLRVQIGDTFFTQHATFSPAGGEQVPSERAQLYTNPADPDQSAAYVELEFTSPQWTTEDLREGELVVTWTLWKPAK
jgi:hypothetical protein